MPGQKPSERVIWVSLLCTALMWVCLIGCVALLIRGRDSYALLCMSGVVWLFRFDRWQRRTQVPRRAQSQDNPPA